MLTILIRAILLYFILVLTMRAMGKRQLGQFQPYEFVMVMLIANLIAIPMSDVSTPLLHGLLPVAALYISHSLITLLCLRSDRIRAVLSGKPSLVISRGVIRQEELKRLCLTLSDLMEGLRMAGYLDPTEVCTAVMEANGTITAFPHAGKRPVNAGEAGVRTEYEGMPMILIMDGRLQEHNLRSAMLDQARLSAILTGRGLAMEGVFLCVVDTRGRMTIQENNGNVMQFQALNAGEVKW